MLIASTSEVYGKSDDVPFREDADLVLGATTKGRWSYACSKAIDEFLALAYWKEKQLPVVVVRLFNTVGPRQTGRYGMVIPNFVKQALLGHPITVYGDGTQSRCFTYVTDVVDALVKLAEHPDAVGQVFNIGNDHEEITILDLAQRVKARTRSKSEIEMVPYDKAYEEGFEDMPRRVPDLDEDPRPHRLRAQGAPRRDPRPGGRVLHGRTRRGFDRGPPPPPPPPPEARLALGGLRRRRRLHDRRQPPPHPALHDVPRRRPTTATSRCCCSSPPRPRSSSASASTPASSASTTTWTTDDDRRRLAGTVALFAVGGGVGAARGRGRCCAVRSRARSSGAGAPEGWVVLAAADVFAGHLRLRAPRACCASRTGPRLFSAFSVVRHTVNIVLKVVLVSGGHGITGILWTDLAATGASSPLALLADPRSATRPRRSPRPLLRDVLAFAPAQGAARPAACRS